MDRRLQQISEILCSEGEVSPEDLAHRLGVSTRSVRTYIGRLNDLMSEQGKIETKNEPVYRLDEAGRQVLESLLDSTADAKNSLHPACPHTPDERVAYMLDDLLNRDDWVTIEQLAHSLYVSRPAITDGLKEVEHVLARYDLHLSRRPRYGIRIEGSELKRRLCLGELARKGLIGRRDVSDMLADIEQCVREATVAHGFTVNALAYQNLISHLAVAVERVLQGCCVHMSPEQFERIRVRPEYDVAGAIARNIERAFDLRIPHDEVAYIAIHLAGRQRLYFAMDAPENDLVISDEVWDVVTQMLDCVWEAFRFDFKGDLELRMNLAQHVVPLSVRLRFGLHIDNSMLGDIQKRYPLAWAMGFECSAVLADTYDACLSDEEVGYIALAFALALERRRGGIVRKNIVVACASGAASAHLLEHRYRQEFGPYLDRIVTCDVDAIGSMDLTGIDYVFTTVPLSITLPVPVRQVGFFLDDAAAKQVRQALQQQGGAIDIASHFDRSLFLTHRVFRDKAEAISCVCKEAARFRAVPCDFEEQVWKRERVGFTAFGNQVSMPHPMVACTDETFVCVCLLDQPLEWQKDVQVRAIFLVSVARGPHGGGLQDFYDRMARLLLSSEDMDTLISQQDFDVLLELLHTKETERRANG